MQFPLNVKSEKIELVCKYDPLTKYTCDVISYFENSGEEPIFSLAHEDGNEGRPVTCFRAESISMPNIPKGLSKKFKSVKNIIIVKAHLRTIEKADFEGFSSIENLDFANNKLKYLDGDVFEDLKLLKFLDLSNNQIEKLNKSIFYNLRYELTTLNLSHNMLGQLDEDIFKNLINLKTLQLEDNKLMVLPPKLFESTKNLITLDISNNHLQSIENGVFGELIKIESIHLQNNPDKIQINWTAFNLPSLTQLQVASEIWKADPGLLQKITNYMNKMSVKVENPQESSTTETSQTTTQRTQTASIGGGFVTLLEDFCDDYGIYVVPTLFILVVIQFGALYHAKKKSQPVKIEIENESIAVEGDIRMESITIESDSKDTTLNRNEILASCQELSHKNVDIDDEFDDVSMTESHGVNHAV